MHIGLKEINRLAIPAIIAGVAEPMISIADSAVAGRLGVTELGAVGVGTSLYTIIVWVLAQTKSAISSIVSQNYGEQRLKEIEGLIPQSILLNVLLGVVFFIAINAMLSPILRFYNAEGELFTIARDYFFIRSLGLPITLAVFGMFGVFRGLQNTSWAMWISILGASLNVILDIVLVFGLENVIAPKGVQGAAWASVIAQIVMFVLCVLILYRKTDFYLIPSLSVHPDLIRLMKLSGNLFIRTLALNVVFFISTKYATSYGESYIAAHTIAMNIWLFSAFFIDGYSSAGNAIAGRLLGEGRIDLLVKLSKDLTKTGISISLLLATLYAVLYPFIANFFSPEKEVTTIFEAVFWIIIISQPINAVAFIYDGIFKGLGEAKFLRNVLIIGTFLGFMPVIMILDKMEFQLIGVWIAILIWMVIRAISLYVKFRLTYQRQLR